MTTVNVYKMSGEVARRMPAASSGNLSSVSTIEAIPADILKITNRITGIVANVKASLATLTNVNTLTGTSLAGHIQSTYASLRFINTLTGATSTPKTTTANLTSTTTVTATPPTGSTHADLSSITALATIELLRWDDRTKFGEITGSLKFEDLFGVSSFTFTFNGPGPTFFDGPTNCFLWERPTFVRIVLDLVPIWTGVVEGRSFNDDPTRTTVTNTIIGRQIGCLLEDGVVYGSPTAAAPPPVPVVWLYPGTNLPFEKQIPQREAILDTTSTSVSKDTARRWIGASRGSIFLAMLYEAQTRGAATGITLGAVNQDTDSAGAAWEDRNRIALGSGTDLLSLINDWGEYGWDWHVGPDFKLDMWLLKTRDLSNTIRLTPAVSMSGYQEATDTKNIRNAIVGEDPNGGQVILTDPTSITTWRRRESWQAYSGTTGDVALTVADQIAQLRNPTTQRTVDVIVDRKRMPWIHYGLGDTVALRFGSGYINVRILAMAAEVQSGTIKTVQLTCDGLLTRTRKRFIEEALQNPAENPAGGGTDSGAPDPPGSGGSIDLTELGTPAGAIIEFLSGGYPEQGSTGKDGSKHGVGPGTGSGRVGTVIEGGNVVALIEGADIATGTPGACEPSVRLVAGEIRFYPNNCDLSTYRTLSYDDPGGGSREVVFSHAGSVGGAVGNPWTPETTIGIRNVAISLGTGGVGNVGIIKNNYLLEAVAYSGTYTLASVAVGSFSPGDQLSVIASGSGAKMTVQVRY